MFIITPLHRERDLYNALNNYYRQDIGTLILVLNTDSTISIEALHDAIRFDKNIIVLYSDSHVAHARNKALKYIRGLGNQKWVNMDADDYYGWDYARRRFRELDNYRYIGNEELFIELSDNRLILAQTPIPMGSTLCGWSDCVDYSIGPNEDGKWFQDMKEKYKENPKYMGHNPYGHLYRRHDNNTWKVSDKELIRSMLLRSINPCWDYGYDNNNIDVCNAKIVPRKLLSISEAFYKDTDGNELNQPRI